MLLSPTEKVILLGSCLDRGKALGVLIRGNRLYMCERHFNIIELEFVAMAPLVLSPTEERQVASGSDVVLEAYATGTEPMAYRWFHDNTELDAISGPTLTLAQIGTSDLGEYSVEVSNAFGSITHTVASLSAGRQVDPVTWISPAAGQRRVLSDRSKPFISSRASRFPEQRHAAPLTDARIIRNQPEAVNHCRRDDQLIRRVLVKPRGLQRRDALGDRRCDR